ncbi:transglutaminase domain-containing protein [Candidatus Methanoperedens nitratireducens]|uniref:Transglutaminase-like domain-containing protein n=1 Tax=Candidatus Methanoperedens nitratireducens TaxID=1392998 RepID=A0A284VMC2_9EURY|nr:transglutaminase domain-containing protein [Candidatus Methanoperedens nitroreducens]SNQ60404.1 hypothetical protein MNV_180036 [Candidatus Methanoperedens nitroreducens]
MTKLRRIVLNGLDTSEKLRVIGKYARLLIEYGKRDPQVRELAVRTASNCRGKDALCEVKSLHAYVRDNIRYIKDIANVERFATPQRTLFLEKAGDCDDSSIALSALLESIGYETRLVLVDPQLTGKFSHVIAQVLLDDEWHWMETTRKVPFDWRPPFTISYVVDKNSAGDEVMKELDDLFNMGSSSLGETGRGRSQGRGRKIGWNKDWNTKTRTGKISAELMNRKKQMRDLVLNRVRSGQISRDQATTAIRRLGEVNDLGELEELGWSLPKLSIPKISIPKISLPVWRPPPPPPKPVSTPPKTAPVINRIVSAATQARNIVTAVQKKAIQTVSAPTKPLLSAIAKKADQTRTTLVKKAQTALATQQKITEQKKADAKNILQNKWNTVQDLIKKGGITAQQAKQVQEKLRQQATTAAEKLKADHQQKNALILAQEAKKEKEIAAKQVELVKTVSKEPIEKVTSEYDPYRGNWVRSEEGDIIRPGGERGYWSKEPPRPEFRLERRLKLAKEKQESQPSEPAAPQTAPEPVYTEPAPSYIEPASQFTPEPEQPSFWEPEPAPEPEPQPEPDPQAETYSEPAPEQESVTEPASEEFYQEYSEEGGDGSLDFEMGGLGSAGLGIWELGATATKKKKKKVSKTTAKPVSKVKKTVIKPSVLLKAKPGETQAQKNLRLKQNTAILRAKSQTTKRQVAEKEGTWQDKLIKAGAILGGLAIGGWIVKDVIIAKVTKR